MTRAYEQAMSPEVMAYLESRGITESAAQAYRLGTVDCSAAEHVPYRGMLSIPYTTPLGGVVGIKFRQPHACTDGCGHKSKYVCPYKSTVYNTPAFTRGEAMDLIAVTEGELDALILDHLVGIPTVGIPGATMWQAHKEFPLLFAGFSRVLVFADPDEPGFHMAKNILQDVDGARMVELPGMDVNDTYLNFGPDAIRKLADVDV